MEAANLRDGGFSVGCIVPGHESQPRGAGGITFDVGTLAAAGMKKVGYDIFSLGL